MSIILPNLNHSFICLVSVPFSDSGFSIRPFTFLFSLHGIIPIMTQHPLATTLVLTVHLLRTVIVVVTYCFCY